LGENGELGRKRHGCAERLSLRHDTVDEADGIRFTRTHRPPGKDEVE